MATATKKPKPSSPSPEATPRAPTFLDRVLWPFDHVFRFLASLKLAVISLGTLALVLSYATFFEKWYGPAAVQEWIYMSKGFAILLAFLGANILCAALIRYPWKKRQTGFVITHAGLLVLLGGSWYALMTSDEGQVAALENEVKAELVRRDYPVVRVREVDPNDPDKVEREWELPFRPGSFPWGPGQPRPNSVLATLNPLNWLSLDEAAPVEVLTRPGDPFRLVVKSHIPTSVPAIKHVADPDGAPMVKIRPLFKAPQMPEARDLFNDEEERWFVSDQRVFKVVREVNPAQFTFYYVDRPELVEDFLNPVVAGKDGVARFRYQDAKGRTRTHDWPLDDQAGKTITLPESDLTVKFLDLVAFPAAEAGLGQMLGAKTVPIAEFEVRKADGPPLKHFALAALPMFPNVIPSAQAAPGEQPRALVSINYDLPPVVDPKLNGLFGVVEVLGTPEGSIYHRVWGRAEDGKGPALLRSKGPLKKGQSTTAFGGNPNLPMTLSFVVEDYLTKGIEKQVCEPLILPPNQMGDGIAASLVEMTVLDDRGKEHSKEFYIRRSNSLEQLWQPVTFPGARYQISYDVDRKPLGFELKLVDFDRGFDPGTEQASRFQSDVLLTDPVARIKDQPHRISMNEPLTHKGYTFYQSSYIREQDPRTGRETGRVQSVLHVGKNPGRIVIYGGCLLICLGIFVQFYMRAGVFTDGGHHERQREAARAVKAALKKGEQVAPEVLAMARAKPSPRRAADSDEIL